MATSHAEQLRDQSGTYLPRVIAIFFCVFDPTAGPSIECQVPEGTVATALSTFPDRQTTKTTTTPAPSPSSAYSEAELSRPTPPPALGTVDLVVRQTPHDLSSNTQVLFDFNSVKDFVIPRQELCGHLITKATRNCKILGFPIWIDDATKYAGKGGKYNRNAFIFNVCFVFEREAELSGFEPIVRKTGRFLRTMEDSISLLSSPPPSFQIANVLEQIFLDLNAYSESSVLVHDTQLDLWPLPFHVNPRPINPWDVPLAVSDLANMRQASWDVTLFKVCAFIDGVNHVKRIAELAEVDGQLARLCVQHLVYYSAVILVDLFQFTNCYTVLPAIADLVPLTANDEANKEGAIDLGQECEAYVYSGTGEQPRVPFATLLELYTHLKPGVSVGAWIDQHGIDGLPIDPRRMVQYGIIKGFLRRVYAYPVWLEHPDFVDPFRQTRTEQFDLKRERARRGFESREDSTTETSAFTTPRPQTPRDAPAAPQERTAVTAAAAVLQDSAYRGAAEGSDRPSLGPRAQSGATEPSLRKWPRSFELLLNGSHHTDELCLRYGTSLRHLEGVLKEIGGAAQESEEQREERSRDAQQRAEGEGQRRGSVTDFGPRMSLLYI